MNFFHAIAYAAEDWDDCVVDEAASFQCLEPLFANLVTGVLSLSGVAVFVMLLVAGFGMLFAGGDPKKLEAARGTFTNAIFGLVVIVSAYLILRIIGVFTGTESTLMNFEIPIQ